MVRPVAVAKLFVLTAAWAATAQDRAFVTLPAQSFETKDAVTGIPVTIRISAFMVSPTEVTQQDYSRVMGMNPSVHKGDNLPVENVAWWDAIRYCNLRSIQEGLSPCYDLATGSCDRGRTGYRLLTDAEWSYASGSPIKAEDMSRLGNLGPAATKDASALLEYVRSHGTQPAGRLSPNEHGLYDVYGNVWEWVQDYHDPAGAVSGSIDPAGPASGTARIIRGGSYVSLSSRWSRGLRSSMEPEWRSPYTGFRVCRTIPTSVKPDYSAAKFQNPPASVAGQTGGLSSLLDTPRGRIGSPGEWQAQRQALRKKWIDLLGTESSAPAVAVRHVATHHEPGFDGELMYLQVEPEHWEKIYLMLPANRDPSRPLPVVVVPFYDVDTSAGKNMGGRAWTAPGTRSFGHLAVQQGFAAVAIRWFGESYAESYAEAVANLKVRHPNLTGLGKWVWDSHRLLDYLATRPEIEMNRVGMIGHSLGGKMTLYATAMDDRIRAAVSSEPGIGLSFSNYDDYWYLGENIRKIDKSTDHHELLALVAPRPFLLIGGDSSDNDKSWYYVNSAKAVYSLLGQPERIGYFNHRSGHSPTPESVQLAMEWLSRYLRDQ